VLGDEHGRSCGVMVTGTAEAGGDGGMPRVGVTDTVDFRHWPAGRSSVSRPTDNGNCHTLTFADELSPHCANDASSDDWDD